MAYYKLVIQVWCDWDPGESDLRRNRPARGAGRGCDLYATGDLSPSWSVRRILG